MSGRARFLPADQLTLPLGHVAASSRADFVVAPSNEVAVQLVDRWPDWPVGRVAAIIGAIGSGKSHLARIFAARSGATIVSAASPIDDAAQAFHHRSMVIEDVDRAANERALLHAINALAEAGAALLITARTMPAAWPIALPDLASRLRQVYAVEIGPPDDALIGALIVKLFSDRQVVIGPGLVSFLLPRIERSHEAIHRLVDRLDETALKAGRPVDLALARAVLGQEPPYINDP